MNAASDITGRSDRQHRDAVFASAMRDREDDICSLLNMARILGDMLEDYLVEYDGAGYRAMPEPGGVMRVTLVGEQVEMLSFASSDVIGRAKRLKESFYEAHEAAGVA